jgi:DNA-binding MarR family transcriptional regulator
MPGRKRSTQSKAPYQALDLMEFVPYLLGSVTNRITANAARNIQREFGVGVAEWRILAMLAIEPGATVARTSELSGIDQSAISRSLHALTKQGLVESEDNPDDRRQKFSRMTSAGQQLYNRILPRALLEERKLLSVLTTEQQRQLIDILRILHARLC